MPVATHSLIQTLNAKDQFNPIPERILQEFADLNELMQARDTSSEPYDFKVMQGFFRQSDPSLVAFSPQQVLESEFGLMETDDERWDMFKTEIKELNEKAPKGTRYVVLFCMRHGQGEHNLVMTNNDPDSWKLAYAEKNGAVDPKLTELGKAQATAVGAAWKDMLERGIPKPEKYLVSPLVRSIETMNLTYGELMEKDQKPMVIENLRGIFVGNTWDQRRTKSELADRYPNLTFEQDFSEQDPYQQLGKYMVIEGIKVYALKEPIAVGKLADEGNAARLDQVRSVLYQIALDCPETYIAVTGHRRCLTALFAFLHHRNVRLAQGEIIPAVIKITEKDVTRKGADGL